MSTRDDPEWLVLALALAMLIAVALLMLGCQFHVHLGAKHYHHGTQPDQPGLVLEFPTSDEDSNR